MASTVQHESISRAQRYIDAKVPLPLVEIDVGGYLLDVMQQLGPIRSTGMGLAAPDWLEITAFASAFRLHFEPWEYRLIRRMCGAYLREFNAGKEPLSMPPIERHAED